MYRYECEGTELKLQPLLPGLLLTGSVAVLVVMPAKADVVQVRGVRLNPTANGLEVILKTTSGTSPQINTSSDNQTLLIDLSNAQLNLSEGQEFRADNPVQGITSVTVTPLSSNSIRVRVTGTQALPQASVVPTPEELVLSVSTPQATTPPAPTPVPGVPVPLQTPQQNPTQPSTPTPATQTPQSEEEIEIVATGERQTGYRVPDATTATRTDTPLRDIPQSVQVIPQRVLEDQQVIRLEEALQNVSSVTFSGASEGQGLNISIRGFNNAPILQDGFRQYGLFGSQTVPDIANLERIEVLKGPASILFGEIQPGGVINAVTKRPLANPFYEAEFQVGNRNLFQPRLDFSGPLTEDGKFLYRLNALYEQNDSFRGFEQDIQRVLVAPVVTWKISDRTDLTVLLEYSNNEQPADFGRVALGERVLDTPRSRITGEPDDFTKTERYNVGYDLEHRFSNNWTLRNSFRYLKRNLTQEFAFPLSFDETTGIVTRYYSGADIDIEQYSLQTNIVGKFATGSVKHTLLFGVDLNRTNDTEQQGLDFSTPLSLNIFDPVYGVTPRPNRKDLATLFDNTTDTDRLGVYVQDQITLTDNLKLLAGLRYDTVTQNITTSPGFFNPVASDTSNTDDAFTPRVGIVYQPIKELSLYGSYSRSFTPNTGTSADGSLLKPERGEGFEVGVKTDLLRSRLSATLAYFDITKQNVATADPNLPFSSVATGEQQSRGVELDVTGQILPGWNIIAAYAYTDAEVTKDNTIPIGNRLAGIPKHSASLWTTYELQSGDLRGLGIGIGFNYMGEREGDLENSFKVGSYFLTDAAVFYRRNNWRVGLNFKNIFDIDYTPGVPNGRTRIPVGEPFTVIGSISVSF